MGFFSPGNRFLFAAQNAIIAGMKRFRDIFLFLLFAFVFSAFFSESPGPRGEGGRKHRDTPIVWRILSFQVKQIDSGTSALSKLVKESHLTP